MFRFQVAIENRDGTKEWKDVHPVGGAPYEYSTRQQAQDMARLCYGNDPAIVRVIEIKS